MSSLNKVFLIGNLTKDPEIKRTPTGMAVTDLRVAVNRKFKGADGQMKDETCFVNVTAWARQAETSAQYLNKGSQIMVEGRLKYDEWEKNGQKMNRLTVVAENIQFLGAPRQRAEQGAPEEQTPVAAARDEQLPAPEERQPEGDKDDLPF